ncbi:MAG: LicD family protein [Oscillospiraceae bacterium]|nr:LicD family protein [Oscillospiraceae bacterium]
MSELTEIQKNSLELLKEFAEVCDKNNLTYYIIGGTLLGAVRHKGFIPWDDDVDVAVPRKDYNYIIQNADKLFRPPYRFAHHSNCSEEDIVRDMMGKLCNDNILVHCENNNKCVTKIRGIDIFPVDGTPDNGLLRRIHFFKLMCYRMIFKFTFSDNLEINNGNHRSFAEKILIVFAKSTNIGKIINRNKALDKLESTLQKYSLENSSKMAGTFLGAYKLREFTDRRFFEGRKKYKFEDGEFYGTDDYDGYLKCIYGDYMKLPPEKDRVGKHKIIKVEKIR